MPFLIPIIISLATGIIGIGVYAADIARDVSAQDSTDKAILRQLDRIETKLDRLL